MGLRGDYVASLVVILMLLISFLLTQYSTYVKRPVEYSSVEQLVNDYGIIAMYSMNEIPKNVSKVSMLKYFMTNVGLYGEKLLITYDRPVKIVGIEERDVQYKVKAIVVLAKYSEDGVTNIVLGPLVKKDADIYMITTVILNEVVINMTVLGVVVNSSEIIEIRGYVKSNGKCIPNAELNVFMYKVEGSKNITEIDINEVLSEGILLYKISTDYLGRFRIRILSSIIPEKYVVIIVASKEKGGYVILENKPGTLIDIILKGGRV